MATRAVAKDVFVEKLHDWIMQYNREIGVNSGLPEDQLDAILEEQVPHNKQLCGHLYDFLKLEGYIEHV